MSSEKEAGNLLTSENAADFYSQKLGLAVEASVEAVEQTPEPTEEAPQSEPEAIEEATQPEERKQNPKLEKRFSEITKQREAARQEAQREREAREALEARLRDLEAKVAPQAPAKVDEEPKPDQFTDAFEYAKALAEWSAEQALLNRDKQEAERKANEERQKLIQSWQTKLEQAKATLPDYEEMIASSDVVVNDDIRDAILESDVGPQILYHLAENPEIAKKITGGSTRQALRELGKLEARLEAKQPETKRIDPVVARSKAPEPISPIRAANSVPDVGMSTDGKFHGTYADWKAARKAGKIR